MISLRNIAFAAALALVPSVAFAGDKPEGEKAHFPMPGDEFVAKTEQRVGRMETRVEERLAKSKLDDEEKAKVRTAVGAAANRIRAAAKNAASDGTVTKEEAKEVRKIAKAERKNLRLHKKGKGKGKAKAKGRKNRGGKNDRAES